MNLNELFKNTDYDGTIFSDQDKTALEKRIFIKTVKDVKVPYIKCIIREKDIKPTLHTNADFKVWLSQGSNPI